MLFSFLMCKLLCNPVTVKVSRVISLDVMVRTTGLIYGVYDTKQLIELKELNVHVEIIKSLKLQRLS